MTVERIVIEDYRFAGYQQYIHTFVGKQNIDLSQSMTKPVKYLPVYAKSFEVIQDIRQKD